MSKFGFFPGTTIPRKAPAREEYEGKSVCKRCGAKELVWEQTGRGWRLFTIGGTEHVCGKGTR
jgi:hypothetical protein